ncbi:ArsR/SmtB family transcription factor [Ruania alba]|uniref:Transcriptional regulator, ArsR family n=1 Tax=Ruania alba TaxID=648782 RepID=A0A1H5LYZ9_9MICO|nr:metalloregulator ArsR/SmtB family transcription factor [Ruania alba]SEE82232.1 transcriptional regulator, ArsR family [Ruania alba]
MSTPRTVACCTEVGPVPSRSDAERIAAVFKALGDPTRVTLLALITASAAGEMCVCDLTEPVGLSQPTVSHHMKVLVDAGLVQREQRGRWAYYRPSIGALVSATHELTGT